MLSLLKKIKFLEFIPADILIIIDKIIIAVLILLATHLLAIILRRSIFNKMEKRQQEKAKLLSNLIPMDRSLIPILRGITTTAVYIIGVSISLETLGIISRTSILALFGSLGLGAGFAVKDMVSNAVSGIILLASRPFKMGDYIECNGTGGTIKEICVLTTKLENIDGILIAIPNTMICANPIINYSSNKIRRMVISIPVSHQESLEKVSMMLHHIVDEEPRFLKNPQPQIVISEIQNNAVQVQLRAWATSENYWDTYYDNLKKVKEKAALENIDLHAPALMQVSSQ